MAETTLDRVRRLVDQLSPREQVHLLEYLTPRIAQAVDAAMPNSAGTPQPQHSVTNAEIIDQLGARGTSLERLLGIGATDVPPPTDDEVKGMYTNHLTEKYS